MLSTKNYLFLFLFLLSSTSYVFCQQGVSTFGNAYIQSGSEIGIHGELFFNNDGGGDFPGVIITNRNESNPGIVVFGKNSSWQNASSDRYIDGYVKSAIKSNFIFPVGHLQSFKPILVNKSYDVVAAYTQDNPLNLPQVNSNVRLRASTVDNSVGVAISETEYWDIRGTQSTKITFSWDAYSKVQDLTNSDLSKLTLLGWNGTEWIVIPSSIDETKLNQLNELSNNISFSSGAIITDSSIVPDDYQYFTFGAVDVEAKTNESNPFDSEISNNELIEFTVFPNPSTNLSQVNLDYVIENSSSGKCSFVIFNNLGELVFQRDLENKRDMIKIPFSSEYSGTYRIGIITDRGSRIFKSVVIID